MNAFGAVTTTNVKVNHISMPYLVDYRWRKAVDAEISSHEFGKGNPRGRSKSKACPFLRLQLPACDMKRQERESSTEGFFFELCRLDQDGIQAPIMDELDASIGLADLCDNSNDSPVNFCVRKANCSNPRLEGLGKDRSYRQIPGVSDQPSCQRGRSPPRTRDRSSPTPSSSHSPTAIRSPTSPKLNPDRRRGAAAGSFVAPPPYWANKSFQGTPIKNSYSCPSLEELLGESSSNTLQGEASSHTLGSTPRTERRRRRRRRTPRGEKSPSARNLMVSPGSRQQLSSSYNDACNDSSRSLGTLKTLTRNDSSLFVTASRIKRRGSLSAVVCTPHQA